MKLMLFLLLTYKVGQEGQTICQDLLSLREKCSNTEFVWSVFSCIRTEYGDLQSI